MPRPVTRGQRYMPGLDGLRAVAVLAVLFYHLGFGWASGGLLGVGVFFTLSGYLITDLLLAELSTGRIRLGDFWLGRARRLLPALFVMLAVVVAWVALLRPQVSPGFGNAVAGGALYVSNWQQIFQHVSYFERFSAPTPLNHLWSLGIEEQFYLLWPLLLIGGVRCIPERSRLRYLRPRLAALTLALAGASAIEMAVLYHPSLDPSRVYYGTDTRAFELLAGAALAMVWPSRRLTENISPGARWVLDCVGAAGLIAIGLLIWRTTEYSRFIYHGGLALLSLATVLVIAALVHPAARLGGLLGAGILRWIDVRSYGIYLWHLPIFVLTTPAGDHGVNLGRAALQTAATFGVAALSWRFVEQPVRHGALGSLWRRLLASRGRPQLVLRRRVVALAWTIGLVSLAALLAGAGGSLANQSTAPDGMTASSASALSTVISRTVKAPTKVRNVVRAASPRTSCHAAVYIGDSTSDGLVSPSYLPNPHQRIEARLARVGVRVQHIEISGARSIVETLGAAPNAYEVAQHWRRRDYHGCWVLALGTNDAANVYVGSNIGMLARIRRMMEVIGRQPVMWVNVKSLLNSGPYADKNMRRWDAALLQACHAHPNMRVFDWAGVVRKSWFIDDGVHYNTPGYAQRSRLIARALARGFPAVGASRGCVVS